MSTRSTTTVACPTCRKPVAWVAAETFKPFCSERCKLIDLGDWATEAHKIPGEPLVDDPSDDDVYPGD
ncbi:DNA gyrase inhibitor YacG [Methylomonas sp. UP202]|uniref:DNA gyrase inhibitor YacG n=1 Tax=Methylomonas sp. UP202 TaxID=3040943 RepID=UPI002478C5E4|nr:DNA gyrase inhibitor YacG [Methylomonas sp. UP202]WGS85695.1 DNA gyrase inhibitor YacG [Methylomonas sp. UP202]